MTEPWPEDFELRGWQREAYEKYFALNQRDFLCVATPGAGKTSFALYLAAQMLMQGGMRRIVVVVPTDHLRRHWLLKASEFGIQLDDAFTNKMKTGEAADYDGVVVTYAQVATEPILHRALCGQKPTFLILDEPHHAASGLHWGDQIRQAFEPARRRLLITGTPYRSDNNPIPFVDYSSGKGHWDFHYGYGDAIRDGVCREVYFPSYEGDLRWYSEDDGERRASFRDELSEDAARRRLDTALDPSGEWLRTVLREADDRLLSLRENVFADAAGLVITKHQTHAQEVCKLLRGITGEQPALAISDEPGSSQTIEDFARVPSPDHYLAPPPKRWIVAVKMVSEGVDIPRLFVGVYATNVSTELYFRQAVGRFVRKMPDLSGQAAFVFMPRDPLLVQYAQTVKEEREHALEEIEEREERERQQRLLDAERRQSTFQPLGSTAQADDVFYDGEAFSQQEVADGRMFLRVAGIDAHHLSDVQVARLFRMMRERLTEQPGQETSSPAACTPTRPKRIVKDELRDDGRSLVSRWVGLAGQGYMKGVFDFKFAWRLLNHATATTQANATEEQLDARKTIIKGWIELAKAADPPLSESDWWREADDARRRLA